MLNKMNIVEDSYQKYGNKLAMSYNGGKESDIVLNMVMKICPKITIYYVKHIDDFSEITSHIRNVCFKYCIDLLIFDDMKSSIIKLKEKYGIEAILTGIRSTDPYAPLSHYQVSDEDWSNIILVTPLLNWSYKDVWNHIIDNGIDYCRLYDKGYTSIGIKGNTFPNYYLYNVHEGIYDHASKLNNDKYERYGRIKSVLPIETKGTVIKGKGWGKKILNIPTANLNINEKDLGLIDGVYSGDITVDGINYLFVMSCGTNPQFGDKSFEVHIIDMPDINLYGNVLRININRYIRSMEKYETIDELKNAMVIDINIVKSTKL